MLEKAAIFLLIEAPILGFVLWYFRNKPPPKMVFLRWLWKVAHAEATFLKLIKFWRSITTEFSPSP